MNIRTGWCRMVRGGAEVAARQVAVPPEESKPGPESLPPGKRVLRSRLVTRLAEERPVGEPFAASQLVAEVNRRFGPALDQPPTSGWP